MRPLRLSFFAVLICCLPEVCNGSEPGADIVFRGGAVYTVNRHQPWASAVAVTDGRIVFVGDDQGAETFIGAETRVMDLAGHMLLPGFHDSHTHLMAAGTRFLRCQLKGLDWPAQVLAALESCFAALEPGKWLRGVGLAAEVLAGNGPGTSLLDRFTPMTPAVIQVENDDTLWVNGAALRLAGITAQTPDLPQGLIEREAGSRKPSGVLRGAATSLVYNLIPPYSTPELQTALRLASAVANGFGITSVNEASARAKHIRAYLEVETAGQMSLRVWASQWWNPEKGPEQISELDAWRQSANGKRFKANSVKFFLDGSSLWQPGAVLEPYLNTANDRGTLYYAPEQLNRYVQQLDALGFDLHFHAYGDAAVRQALNAIEYAVGVNPRRDRRHQIAHLALINPADLPRIAALDVTADIQPLWDWLSDERKTEAERLGPERAARLMQVQSLFASDTRVVAGSDWISDSMNPLVAIQIALTRRPPDNRGPAWNARERATLDEMIQAYTINGAWLARQENETGSIEPGKAADLVVLDRNLFVIEPEEISTAVVLLTLLEGRVVYRNGSLGW